MSDETVQDRVRAVISRELGISLDTVTEETSVEEDLGADSLDVVEIVMGLEEEFGLEIIDEDAEKWGTVGDIIKALEERTG